MTYDLNLTPRRHQEFLPAADEDDIEPLELRFASSEEMPSLIFGDEEHLHVTMTPPKQRMSASETAYEEHDEYLQDTLSCDDSSYDDSSTSAQAGGGINDGPPEKLVHAVDLDQVVGCFDLHSHSGSSVRLDASHSEPSTESVTDSPVSSESQPDHDELCSLPATLDDQCEDGLLLSPPACQKTLHMSPYAATETTYCSGSSTNQPYFYSEEDNMSWEEWKELIATQLSPWCDLMQASHEEEEDLMDVLTSQFQEDFAHQNDVQKATALAFLQGLSLQKEKYATKLTELEEQQRQQLAMLQQTQSASNPIERGLERKAQSLRFRYGSHRHQMLHAGRKWKPSSGASVANTNDFDNQTVTSVFSTMSCRELSISRYQRSCHRGGSNDTKKEEKQNDDEVQRLLKELQDAERKQKRLEQQLQQAGVVLAEDIPYQEAKDQVARISKRMNEIGSSGAEHDDPQIQNSLREEYFRLEKDMEKFMSALLLTDEYIAEQQAQEDAWEEDNREDNLSALQQVRRHMPVNVRLLTKEQLLDRNVPAAMVKKFQRTNVLQLLRRDPVKSIARWHPSNLESLRVTGLTLTERRALHSHLLPLAEIWAKGTDPLTERKQTWFTMMRTNFKESLLKYQHHLKETDGQEGSSHQCNLLGRQCPVVANATMDYSGEGLGFPDGDVYEESLPSPDIKALGDIDTITVDSASASSVARSQRNLEKRLEGLRQHYKTSHDKVQQVSLALGVCESMDTLMDRMEHQMEVWILEQLQSTSNISEDGEQVVAAQLLKDLKRELSLWTPRSRSSDGGDLRSLVEVCLMEELYETASDYMAALKQHTHPSTSLESTMDQLEPMLELSHSSNLMMLSQFPNNLKIPAKTRKRKSRTEIMASLWTKDCSASETSSLSTSKGGDRKTDAAIKTRRKKKGSEQMGEKGTTTGRRCSSALAEELKKKGRQVKQAAAPTGLLAAICARRAEV